MDNYSRLYRRFLLCRNALVALIGTVLLLSVGYIYLAQQNREQERELSGWRFLGNEIESDPILLLHSGQMKFEGRYLFDQNFKATPASAEAAYNKTSGIQEESNSQVQTLSVRVDTESQRARRWESLARAMSKEADRRHLDKSFPRVKD